MREETHQPAKIYRHEVSIVERADPVSLNVRVYNQVSSSSVSAMNQSWMKLTLLMAHEGDLWMFHIDFAPKIHPTKAVYHIPLTVLGNRVRVSGHGELEGCIRDITRPFTMVPSDLLVYFFVRCARGVQFAQRPEKIASVHLWGEGGLMSLLDQDAPSCQDEGVLL